MIKSVGSFATYQGRLCIISCFPTDNTVKISVVKPVELSDDYLCHDVPGFQWEEIEVPITEISE